MSYITMYFRRPDGTDIVSCPVMAAAPWIPKVGDDLNVSRYVCTKEGDFRSGTRAEGHEERRTMKVLAVLFELYYVHDGDFSEVRYVVTVEDPYAKT